MLKIVFFVAVIVVAIVIIVVIVVCIKKSKKKQLKVDIEETNNSPETLTNNAMEVIKDNDQFVDGIWNKYY